MKKLILPVLTLCIYVNAFSQIVPPQNIWTPTGGGNIYYNAGYVGIGLNSPLYQLHVAGNVFVSKNLRTQTITTSHINTDTIKTGIIDVPTGVNGQIIKVDGGAFFNGNLTSIGYRVNTLSGVGDRELFVDSSGSLMVPSPISPTSYKSCASTNPSWRIGGNSVGNRT